MKCAGVLGLEESRSLIKDVISSGFFPIVSISILPRPQEDYTKCDVALEIDKGMQEKKEEFKVLHLNNFAKYITGEYLIKIVSE